MRALRPVHLLEKKGYKLPLYHELLDRFIDRNAYDAFLFCDDDIEITHESLAEFLEEVRNRGLHYAQPSFARGSDAYWRHLRHQPGARTQQVTYVEIQFFFVSRRLLDLSLPFFATGMTGYGLDFILSYLCRSRLESWPVVIHSVTMFHPHRPQGESVRKTFSPYWTFGKSYLDNAARTLGLKSRESLLELTWPRIISTEGWFWADWISRFRVHIIAPLHLKLGALKWAVVSRWRKN